MLVHTTIGLAGIRFIVKVCVGLASGEIDLQRQVCPRQITDFDRRTRGDSRTAPQFRSGLGPIAWCPPRIKRLCKRGPSDAVTTRGRNPVLTIGSPSAIELKVGTGSTVSPAVSFSRRSVDLRACCYDTDAQDLA